MRKLICFGMPLCTLALMTLPASADPILTMSSSATLTTLTVGENAVINVSLSGLAVGSDFIFNLNSKELFSSSLFKVVPDSSNSSGFTPGSILSGASQGSNFNAASSLSAGSAVGDFSDASPASSVAISQNGLFYSFVLQAKAAGSGSITFDPTAGANEYAADDTGFNFAPLPTGGSLAYNINPAITASPMPEPSPLGLVGIFGPVAALIGLMRRKRIA
jgi:hypothetical protein